MTDTDFADGRDRLAALRAALKTAEAADPALARRNARFFAHVAAQQERNMKKILAQPDSQAYRDYVLVPVGLGSK